MAKRNLYKNRLNELREYKQNRYIEPFAKVVQQMAKQVNQRFYRLEQHGLDKDTAYRYAQLETGKTKPRYPTSLKTLENMSLQQLYELGLDLNTKLMSKTSTVKGQQEINLKRVKASLESFKEEYRENATIQAINENEYQKALEIGLGQLMNSKYLDSEQVREDWATFTQQDGVSLDEFLEAYTSYNNKGDYDVGAIRRKLKNVVNKKQSKKAKKGKKGEVKQQTKRARVKKVGGLDV